MAENRYTIPKPKDLKRNSGPELVEADGNLSAGMLPHTGLTKPLKRCITAQTYRPQQKMSHYAPCPPRAPERRCGAPEALLEPGRPFKPQRHHCPALGGTRAGGSQKRRGPGRLCLVGSWNGRGTGKDSSWACTAALKAIYGISLKLSKMKPFIGGI